LLGDDMGQQIKSKMPLDFFVAAEQPSR
jgi:hypothetical protein